MRPILIAAATSLLLALTVNAAEAADPSQPSTGADVGTPGAENHGNKIDVPDNATGDASQVPPTTTTPNQENKGRAPQD